ncbi:MAG: branched-chain amino acid ABC transporter permease [Limisphaerales bacterium]
MQNIALMLGVKGVMVGSIYALISLGFNVIFRTTGVLNFAQGEFVMIGGVLSAWLYGTGRVSLGAAMGLGVLGAGVVGVLVDLLAIRPVRKAKPVIQIIITVGVSIVLKALAGLVLGTDRFHLPPIRPGSVEVGGIQVELQSLWILGTAAVCMAGLGLFFHSTTAGRAMRACAENPDAARLCGVNPGRVSALAFGLSALMAGMAGVLLTPMVSMQFDQGTMLGLKGFSAAILGGLGNPVGGVLTGVLLGVLEQLSAWMSSVYKETLALALVVVVLLLRPKGVFSK